jgi:hypothetical protein
MHHVFLFPRLICMSMQTVTGATESDLEPERIYQKLTNAFLIPRWAPVFADNVEHVQGNVYRLTKGGDVFHLELITNEPALTVDYLRTMANGKRGGAYIRVTPRPLNGSVVVMTVPVATNTSPDQVAEVLEQELAALIGLV